MALSDDDLKAAESHLASFGPDDLFAHLAAKRAGTVADDVYTAALEDTLAELQAKQRQWNEEHPKPRPGFIDVRLLHPEVFGTSVDQ